MRDLLSEYDRLAALGRPVGRAVVTSVWGSAPRPEGSSMLATADGTMAGSVSGGCVEGATASEIADAIGRGTPKLVTFGVTHERAWEVGLACGGTIKVFVEPTVRPEVLTAARGPGGDVVATLVDGPAAGRSVIVREDGRVEGSMGHGLADGAIRDAALAALGHEASTTRSVETEHGPANLFLEVFPRQPRLVVFGGVHIAVALVPLARSLGYRTIVADGRPAFLTRERFPDADELILAWPEEAFQRIGLDRGELRLHPVPRSQVRRAGPGPRASLPGEIRRRDRIAEDAGIPSRAAQCRGIRRGDHCPGARAHRPGPGRAPARGDGPGDSGGNDGGAVRRLGRAGRPGGLSRYSSQAGTAGWSGTRPSTSVAGRCDTGPSQMTQLLPGRETCVARADQESSSALRMVIFTPRCHRY